MGAETKSTTCGFCQGGCKVVITLEDGTLTKVKADQDSPAGHVCPRGALVPRFLYDDVRVKHPLIRVGARGEGEFREATWDEAFDHAAKLIRETADKHGARSLASYCGRGVLFNPVFRFSQGEEAFFKHMGSPNDMNCSSICNIASSTVVPFTTMGVPMGMQVPDVERSDYIVSWGKNSASDDGPQFMLKRIEAAQERGAKLIVIDPRQTGLGERADWWIPILPGTDGAFALAVLKVVIGEGSYDKEFVERWTIGFEDLKGYLDTLDTPTLCAQCGVSEKDIRRFTDLFTSTEKISLVSYIGLEYQLSAVQNARAIYTLWAITGKYDVEGGIYLDAWGLKERTLSDVPEDNPAVGARDFPVFYGFTGVGQFNKIPQAILRDDPYPVRGLLVTGGSPALSFPECDTWHEAYAKLDCLIVVDRFFSEEMRYADVVFPATTLYESPRVHPSPEGPVFQDPVVPAVGESRYEVLVLGQLAQRLGFGESFPQAEEDLKEWFVRRPTPFAPPLSVAKSKERVYRKYVTGDMRADGKPGFPMPSGKFEISSSLLGKMGYHALPVYDDVRGLEGFDAQTWPLLMTSGARSMTRMGGLGGNLEGIGNGIDSVPLVDVNAEDAGAVGVADGDKVVVTTPYGSASFTARVCGVAKGAIHVPHGGGSSYMFEAWKNGAVNRLTSLDLCDPITGFPMIKSVPCRIEHAKGDMPNVSHPAV